MHPAANVLPSGEKARQETPFAFIVERTLPVDTSHSVTSPIREKSRVAPARSLPSGENAKALRTPGPDSIVGPCLPVAMSHVVATPRRLPGLRPSLLQPAAIVLPSGENTARRTGSVLLENAATSFSARMSQRRTVRSSVTARSL